MTFDGELHSLWPGKSSHYRRNQVLRAPLSKSTGFGLTIALTMQLSAVLWGEFESGPRIPQSKEGTSMKLTWIPIYILALAAVLYFLAPGLSWAA